MPRVRGMAYSYDRSKTAAAAGTLLAAKIDWAEGVAKEAADRFKSQGGWSQQKTKSTVRVGSTGLVELTTRSDLYGWTGLATFDMDVQKVTAMVEVDDRKDADVDFLKKIQQIQDGQRVIAIKSHDTPNTVVDAISLWWSKAVNPLTPIK